MDINDVPQFAIHQIVAFFMENKNAIKIINNLIVAHWLNIFCKSGGIKWRNCYQHNVNVTQLLTCTFIYRSFIDPENWPANSQYLSAVDFSVCGALQQTLYRQKFRDVDCLKCVLLNCWDQISQDTVSAAIDQC